MKGYLQRTVCASLLFAVSMTNVFAAQCKFEVSNEWGSGFTASLKITNDEETAINNWSVVIDFPDGTQINQLWNGTIEASSPYTVTNKSYNGQISPGSSASFGFNSVKAVSGAPATIPTLGGICQTSDPDVTPIATISSVQTVGVTPFVVQFNGTESQDPNGLDLTYAWDFGDGTTSTLAAPEKTFSDVGEHHVSLTVNNGEHASQPVYIVIEAKAPQPEDAQCEYTIVQDWLSGFTASIKIHNDSELTLDGWSVNLHYPDETHISGSWDSQLTGSNPYELSNANYNSVIPPNSVKSLGFNAQKAIPGVPPTPPELGGICRGGFVINQQPIANIVSSDLIGAGSVTVLFDASTSSDPEDSELTYYWDFGDGSSSEEVAPEKTFEQVGTYQVTLTVNDGTLNSDPVSVMVEVKEAIVVQRFELVQSSSSLHFVSTKKTHVVESHSFLTLTGAININGEARLQIDLNSVETGIAIRNERMREHLFETTTYYVAEVELDIDPLQLVTLAISDHIVLDITSTLSLHGVNHPLSTKVKVTKLSSTRVLVQSLEPVLIDAADFDLTGGIETLRNLASLSVISYAVPVNFTLLFEAL